MDETFIYLRKEFKDLNCLEILFPTVSLMNFEPSIMNQHWLKSLHYKSLHYVDNITKKHYNSLISEYGISKIIVHDGVQDEALAVIKRGIMLIENTEYSNQIYNGAKYCFDLSHYAANKIFRGVIASEFPKFEICQFHLSNYSDGKCHTVFADDRATPEFVLLFKIMEIINVPIIIESVFDDEKQIKKEYEFIKRSLNNE